jgi:hypothetical protein
MALLAIGPVLTSLACRLSLLPFGLLTVDAERQG